MLKFLRKYKKVLLAVLVSFLMLVFIAPQGFQQILAQNSRGPVAATLGGRSVRAIELQDAGRSLEVITQVVSQISPNDLTLVSAMTGLDFRDNVHWLLLVEEARKGGFAAGALEGERLLAQMQVPEESIARLAGSIGMSSRDAYQAIADFFGVTRMVNEYFDALMPSRPRGLAPARETLDSAIIDALYLPCEMFLAAVPEPSEESVREHYETYRDTKEGEGDFGIGYTLPNRVKFVAMQVDRAKIEDAIRPDLKELMLIAPDLGDKIAAIGAEATPPDRDPAEFAQSKQTRIEALKEEARQAVIKQKMPRIQEIIGQVFQTEIHESLRGVTKEGVFYEVPADWASRRPNFDAIALKIAEQVKQGMGLDVPPPTVLHFDDKFRTFREVSALTELSGVYHMANQQFQTPVPYLFSVRELAPDIGAPLQVGVPVPQAFQSLFGGGEYRFMVTEFRGESPPDSMDEIRETVALNARRLAAFELLKGQVDEWSLVAQEQGIEKLKELIDSQHPDLEAEAKSVLLRRVSVTRERLNADQPRLDKESLRESVMELCDSLDPLAPPESRTTAQTTRVEPVPAGLCAAAYTIVAPRPTTFEQARLQIERLAMTGLMTEIRERIGTISPFRRDNLITRLEWVERKN